MTAPLSDETIRVLIGDDSPIARERLTNMINKADGMRVIGLAHTGLDAVRMNFSLNPDVIVMDLEMPIVDGLTATRLIMQETPTRIILLGSEKQSKDMVFADTVTNAGALAIHAKPSSDCDEDCVLRFIKTIRAMSKVGVVRLVQGTQPLNELADYPGILQRPELVVIVSSTGGPPALEQIMSELDSAFPLPIVVVQHISGGFVDSMTNWLDKATPLHVKLADNGEKPMKGHVYVAPAGKHLRMTFNGRFSLLEDTDNLRHVPSGDILLESVARVYGSNAIGIILTGMGMDGAQGLTTMREQGARTIVQNEATSIVFGMPKAAIDLGGGEYIIPLEEIAPLLKTLANQGQNNR